MVRTDFRLRYQSSALGYLWTLMRPIFTFLILYIVFVKFLRVGGNIPHFAVYLLFGIVLWNYFVEITTRSTTVFVDRSDMIRKVQVPRHLLVVAITISASINFILNLFVVCVFAVINGVTFTPLILLLPLLIFELYVLSTGAGLFLSAAYVRLRDVSYVWEIVIQAGFYGVPILYPLDIVPEVAQKLLMLNPLAQIIQAARYSVITQETATAYNVLGWPYVTIPYALVIITAVVGIVFYRSRVKTFAEEV